MVNCKTHCLADIVGMVVVEVEEYFSGDHSVLYT